MIWSHPHESRFFVLLAVGLAVLLFLAFRLASRPTARSKAIIALRSTAIALIVLILLNPVRVEQVETLARHHRRSFWSTSPRA